VNQTNETGWRQAQTRTFPSQDSEALIETIANLTAAAKHRDIESPWVRSQQREPTMNALQAQFVNVASAGD
jgi:hypothetical protein